jgi:integrase
MKVAIDARVSMANNGQDPAMKPVGAANLIEFPAPVVKPRRARRARTAFLSPEETLSVLRTAKDRAIRDWAMVLLAYHHGLRASEVCNLKMVDVNLKDGSISIQRLKGSMRTVQPLYTHRGQPLLDEAAALRSWSKTRPSRPSGRRLRPRLGRYGKTACGPDGPLSAE